MKKRRKIILLIVVVLFFIFCFSLDKKKVSTIPVSHFSSENDYEVFVRKYDSYSEDLLDMFSRNPDMAEYMLGYPEKRGNVYSDTVGELNKEEVPLFLQYDTRWGYGIYGDDVLAVNGCGPTALSMVITYLTQDTKITPYVIAQYSDSHGYYDKGTGSSWNLMTLGSRHFGVIGTNTPLSKENVYKELENGHPIICSMRPGDFTTTGHFIVLTKIVDGKIKVNDSNSKERSNQLWDYEVLEPQIRSMWAFQRA